MALSFIQDPVPGAGGGLVAMKSDAAATNNNGPAAGGAGGGAGGGGGLSSLLFARGDPLRLHAALATAGPGLYRRQTGFPWPEHLLPDAQTPADWNTCLLHSGDLTARDKLRNRSEEVREDLGSDMSRSPSSSQLQARCGTGSRPLILMTPKRRRKVAAPEPPSPPTSGSSPPSSGSGEPPPASQPPPAGRLFTCAVCSRSFGYKHVLQNHERTHTGEKPFACAQCGKRFTRDHHLKTHVRLHTGEKPYRCTHCDRDFVQVANLRRHLRVHTGERPYACELCPARFSDSNQLKAHALIHKGEKPFGCGECQGRFRRRHHLVHHKCGAARPRGPARKPREDASDPEDRDDGAGAELILALHNNNGSVRKERSRKPLEVRHVVRPPPAPAAPEPPPEQTEPEDLSMSTGARHNGYSPPSDDAAPAPRRTAAYLHHRHPKFRRLLS